MNEGTRHLEDPTGVFLLFWLHDYVYLRVTDGRPVDRIIAGPGDNPEWVKVIRFPLGLSEYGHIVGLVACDGLLGWLYLRYRSIAQSQRKLA